MSTVEGDGTAAGRGWTALPRRRPPRPRPVVATLRVPISRRAGAILAAVSILGPVGAWWALSASGAVDPPTYLPSPGATVAAGLDMIKAGTLFSDAWASVERVLIGFGLSVLIAVPLGLLMGSFRSVWALFEPIIGLFRYLPAAAFIPLFIIWLGLGEQPKWGLILFGTVFFNTLMTADVVRAVPIALIDVSYTLGARTGEILRKVIIPHSLPGIIDVVRVNAAAAWSFLVIAELLAPVSGLGYRITRLGRFQQIDGIFAVLAVIGVLGLAVDVLLRVLRDRIGRWV